MNIFLTYLDGLIGAAVQVVLGGHQRSDPVIQSGQLLLQLQLRPDYVPHLHRYRHTHTRCNIKNPEKRGAVLLNTLNELLPLSEHRWVLNRPQEQWWVPIGTEINVLFPMS